MKEGIKIVAIPRLATGVGGMHRDDVKPLIEQHFSDMDAEVFVYSSYVNGQAAEE